MLHTQRVLQRVRNVEGRRKNNELPLIREANGRCRNLSLRIGAGIGAANLVAAVTRTPSQPWLAEAERCDLVRAGSSGERRVLVNAVRRVVVGYVIEQPKSTADDRVVPSLERIPRRAKVRIELPRRAVRETARHTRIPVEEGACRRIRIDRAGLARQERPIVKHRAAVEVVRWHVKWRPADASHNREPRVHAVGVFQVNAGNVPAKSKLLRLALRVRTQCPHQEVKVRVAVNRLAGDLSRRSAAAIGAVESKCAVCLVSSDLIEMNAQEFAADGDLVLPFHPGQIVGDSFVVHVEVPRRTGAAIGAPVVVGA